MFEDWESLGEYYFDNEKVSIAEMNCEPSVNKKICRRFEADRYPRIFMFKNGVKHDKLYDGEREKKYFIQYIEQFMSSTENKRDEN